MDDYLEGARKSKAVFEKHGGKNVRLLGAVVAGEATGTLAFIWEADGPAAHGAVVEKALADPELRSTANSSAGPIATYQITLWADIPL